MTEGIVWFSVIISIMWTSLLVRGRLVYTAQRSWLVLAAVGLHISECANGSMLMTGIAVWQTHGNYGFNWKHFFLNICMICFNLICGKSNLRIAMPRQFHKDTVRKKVLLECAQNSRTLLLFFYLPLKKKIFCLIMLPCFKSVLI